MASRVEPLAPSTPISSATSSGVTKIPSRLEAAALQIAAGILPRASEVKAIADKHVADLDARRHPFHVAIENWQHDLNIGTVVRTANAFNAAGVHIIGRRRWNRRGAMVTDRYLHVRHHETVAAFTEWAAGEGLPVLGVDLFPESVPVETFDFPRACVLVFGQEGPGLSAEVRAASSAVLSIAQYGSTRSINAGVAAGIAMHAWIRQHAAVP